MYGYFNKGGVGFSPVTSGSSTGDIDLSNYVTQDQLDDYALESSLSSYVTSSYLAAQNYVNAMYLLTNQYVTTPQLETLNYVTESELFGFDYMSESWALTTFPRRKMHDTSFFTVTANFNFMVDHNLNVPYEQLIVDIYVKIVDTTPNIYTNNAIIKLTSGNQPIGATGSASYGVMQYQDDTTDNNNQSKFFTQQKAIYTIDAAGAGNLTLEWADCQLRIVIQAMVIY